MAKQTASKLPPQLAAILNGTVVGNTYLEEIQRIGDWTYLTRPDELRNAVARALSSTAGKSRFLWKLAREEACGAAILMHVCDRAAPEHARRDLLKHAEEERRHAKMYFALARAVASEAPFPPEPHIDPVQELGPAFDNGFPRFIFSIHLAEIRNLLIVDALRGAAAHSTDASSSKLLRLSSRLVTDECWHIRYTAEMVSGMLGREEPQDSFRQAIERYAAMEERELQNIHAFAANHPI